MHFQVRSIPTLMIFRGEHHHLLPGGVRCRSRASGDLLDKASELDMDEVRAQIEAEQKGGQGA